MGLAPRSVGGRRRLFGALASICCPPSEAIRLWQGAWHGTAPGGKALETAARGSLDRAFKTCAVWQPHARSVRLRRRSVKPFAASERSQPYADSGALRRCSRLRPAETARRGGGLWQGCGANRVRVIGRPGTTTPSSTSVPVVFRSRSHGRACTRTSCRCSAERTGVIRGPAGDGRFAPVLRDDVADVLVNVLVQPGHDGVTYTLTGPETFALGGIAGPLRG